MSAIPAFDWAPLDARVACGRNPLTEDDAAELAAAGVTHVLDLREPREWTGDGKIGAAALEAFARHVVERRSVPIPDGAAPEPADFAAALGFLDAAHARPGARLYVHCRGGIERTGAILAAWYAWREDLDPLDGLVELVARVPRLAPLPSQARAAAAWLRAERKNGRRPFPRRRPVARADFFRAGSGPQDAAPDTGAPARHVVLPVPWPVRLAPWELRRVKLGLLPREMEEKWLLVWEAPELRAIRSWTGYEIFRLRMKESRDGTARWTDLLASRETEQYSNTDPDEDLATASRLLSFLTGRPHGPERSEERAAKEDEEAKLDALREWSNFGSWAMGFTREAGIGVGEDGA